MNGKCVNNARDNLQAHRRIAIFRCLRGSDYNFPGRPLRRKSEMTKRVRNIAAIIFAIPAAAPAVIHNTNARTAIINRIPEINRMANLLARTSGITRSLQPAALNLHGERAIQPGEHTLPTEDFEQVIETRPGRAASHREPRRMHQHARFHTEFRRNRF